MTRWASASALPGEIAQGQASLEGPHPLTPLLKERGFCFVALGLITNRALSLMAFSP